MKYGDELVLDILKKEYRRLCLAANKAKADCQEAMTAGSELFKLRAEATVILNSARHTLQELEQLTELANREKKLVNIMKKDLVKLITKESDAAILRDELASEIGKLEFRVRRRGGHA